MRKSTRLLSLATVACLAGAAALSAHAASKKAAREQLVYFGTRGSAIFAARLQTRTGALTPLGQVSDVEQPTWLVPDAKRHVLYSVGELGNDGKSHGNIMSFKVDSRSGALTLLDKIDSGGGGTTHLVYSPASRMLFSGSFGTGAVSAFPLSATGRVSGPSSVQEEKGSGPHPRQTSAHAHGVAVSPDGHFVLAADMGADRIFLYRFDAKTRQLAPAGEEAVPVGSGPRHAVFHPNGKLVFVNMELIGGLKVYRWDPSGKLTLTQSLITDTSADPAKRSAAEITVSRDGRFLYVSSRGDNTIAVFSIDAVAGQVTEIQRIPTQGQLPWHFAFDATGRWMLVAEQASGDVVEFKVDPAWGKLTPTDQRLPIASPVNVSFFAG